ncbi:hypothetical protein ONS95_004340 [Cadophora gregata]|uniref:uncharacterized protein n=1 Tax=Cadophora gregata TaxID=51156 RepID=UPI0026DC2C6D|nr:uncharacterized protein ONS95_004340 [Cadophora gregata]KAK0105275.1 hypothetical protein ONS96_004671 [Cadophora gregata f. sp. sojae]KAK0105824.1 hypothetical protein ONS95_004340 [Cadophora gregata]
MAGNTAYHRLPEDNRPSLDSTGEDERLLDPRDDNRDDNPTTPKQKQFKYCFHPTLIFRFVSFVLYLSAAITFLVSHRSSALPAIIFGFLALGRQALVTLHHLLTRFIRVRIRIELREGRSSINAKPKKKTPTWHLPGIISVAIDLILAIVVIATTAAVNHQSTWYYGDVLGGKIVAFIAAALHIISAADLGQPSRLTISGKLTFDKKDDDDNEDGNPPQLPIYRDVEATGAGQVGVHSRKTGADSPPGII